MRFVLLTYVLLAETDLLLLLRLVWGKYFKVDSAHKSVAVIIDNFANDFMPLVNTFAFILFLRKPGTWV